MGRRSQEKGESFETFLAAIKEISHNCQFGDKNDEILRDSIVCRAQDNTLRKHLLQKKTLTLAAPVDMCRAHETMSK